LKIRGQILEQLGSFEELFRPVLFDQALSFLCTHFATLLNDKQSNKNLILKFKIVTVYLSKKNIIMPLENYAFHNIMYFIDQFATRPS
jgi:hypothetical protein